MDELRVGENPMLENRGLANESVNREKRYAQIKEILNGKQLTFREIAKEMYERGYTISPETTYSQPRVTEMVQKGEVEPIGKTKSSITGKTVTVFQLRSESHGI